jgi:hypothetical protein
VHDAAAVDRLAVLGPEGPGVAGEELEAVELDRRDGLDEQGDQDEGEKEQRDDRAAQAGPADKAAEPEPALCGAGPAEERVARPSARTSGWCRGCQQIRN